MSVRALELAVLTQLRKTVANGGLGYSEKDSDIVGPDGKPHPRAGEIFVGVHAAYQRGLQEGCSEEEYGLTITVSRRLHEPFDRMGQKTKNDATRGLNEKCDAIKAMMLKHQYTIISAANTTIDTSVASGFVEPLFFRDGDAQAVEVRADWFSGDEQGEVVGLETVGLKRSMRFGGAVRIQDLVSIT